MGDNYYLSFHPYPVYEGHCVIFNNGYELYKEAYGVEQGLEEDSEEKIAVFDYSRYGRKDNGKNYLENVSLTKSKLKNDEGKSFVNKEEISIFEPLSTQDWAKAYKVVKDTDSIAYIQYLPPGKKNYRHLSNGVISVVPRQFLLKEHQNFGINCSNLDQEEKLPFEKAIEKAAEVQSSKPGGHLEGSLSLSKYIIDIIF